MFKVTDGKFSFFNAIFTTREEAEEFAQRMRDETLAYANGDDLYQMNDETTVLFYHLSHDAIEVVEVKV